MVGLSILCPQCDEAPCVWACLTGALTRDPMSFGGQGRRGAVHWLLGMLVGLPARCDKAGHTTREGA